LKILPEEAKTIVLEDQSWMCCDLCYETFINFELWAYDENGKGLVCLWASSTYSCDEYPYDELRNDVVDVFNFYDLNTSEIECFEDNPVNWEYKKYVS
jgi:hypothetical protein